MSSEDFDMNDSTWMSADPHLASSLSPNQEERMRSPQTLHSQEDGECPSLGSWQGGPSLSCEWDPGDTWGVLESWCCQHPCSPHFPRESRLLFSHAEPPGWEGVSSLICLLLSMLMMRLSELPRFWSGKIKNVCDPELCSYGLDELALGQGYLVSGQAVCT